ncbi:hypothetical protein OED52_02850 [Rhodococcus sp. Z13]|uniref:Uncharacterized protein n=1 Tax=Rhodococcus sacchari TaxID=2962047 RepID=A0ACD4DHP4_9NOCA|nr:hypothetical protein [Rhodococcus sp. Z13]UYP19522.1 hypothetical protein OED52_02850 [Rhodococcus sp. Z13]
MTCSHCNQDIDHCHGTLVLHAVTPAQCTEPDCTDLDLVRHTLVLDCTEIDGGCSCTVVAQEDHLLRIS